MYHIIQLIFGEQIFGVLFSDLVPVLFCFGIVHGKDDYVASPPLFLRV